jgi:endonuclease IV
MVSHIKAAMQMVENEAGFKMTAAALFVGGPHNRKIILSAPEIIEMRDFIEASGQAVIAHSSYTAVPWRGDPDAAKFIREEAAVCQAAGIAGLVVHLPKMPVKNVLPYIPRLLNPEAPTVRIFLEIPAVRPRESFYETPEKISALFKGLRADIDPELRHFGLCVDTAHLWTCGVPLQSYAEADGWLTELEMTSAIIPHEVVMIHLNDSLRALGVGPDAHAALTHGRIWEEYQNRITDSGLAAFTDYAQRHNTITIIERKPKELITSDFHILRKLVMK